MNIYRPIIGFPCTIFKEISNKFRNQQYKHNTRRWLPCNTW